MFKMDSSKKFHAIIIINSNAILTNNPTTLIIWELKKLLHFLTDIFKDYIKKKTRPRTSSGSCTSAGGGNAAVLLRLPSLAAAVAPAAWRRGTELVIGSRRATRKSKSGLGRAAELIVDRRGGAGAPQTRAVAAGGGGGGGGLALNRHIHLSRLPSPRRPLHRRHTRSRSLRHCWLRSDHCAPNSCACAYSRRNSLLL